MSEKARNFTVPAPNGCPMATRLAAREASETNAKLLDYRLKKLEEKQDRHNSMIERMYKVEGAVTELQHEVNDLKKAVPKTAS